MPTKCWTPKLSPHFLLQPPGVRGQRDVSTTFDLPQQSQFIPTLEQCLA
jgi:hypothetical protein